MTSERQSLLVSQSDHTINVLATQKTSWPSKISSGEMGSSRHPRQETSMSFLIGLSLRHQKFGAHLAWQAVCEACMPSLSCTKLKNLLHTLFKIKKTACEFSSLRHRMCVVTT
jgi:hypothetical protein